MLGLLLRILMKEEIRMGRASSLVRVSSFWPGMLSLKNGWDFGLFASGHWPIKVKSIKCESRRMERSLAILIVVFGARNSR